MFKSERHIKLEICTNTGMFFFFTVSVFLISYLDFLVISLHDDCFLHVMTFDDKAENVTFVFLIYLAEFAQRFSRLDKRNYNNLNSGILFYQSSIL